MSKNYLLAVDLEGIHGVVGEKYKNLNESGLKTAVDNAYLELNTAIKSLYDNGANSVVVWDNHGEGDNLDFGKIDKRAKRAVVSLSATERIDFVDNYGFDSVLFFGYHAKEGNYRGVLAHTYDSKNNQYIKINGKQVGEFYIDCLLFGSHDLAPVFFAGDSECIKECKNEVAPDIVYVTTKIAKGRNDAEFIDEKTIESDIYNGVKESLSVKKEPLKITFPCVVESRFTRMEYAEERKEYLDGLNIKSEYKEDGHTLVINAKNFFELRTML